MTNLNDGSDSPDRRWTSWIDGKVLKDPWVQYDFDEEVVLAGCEIWWYNDNGGVKLAKNFEILYKNEQTKEFTSVEATSEFTCPNGDGFSTYTFKEVEVASLRIVIHNTTAAAGIVEWNVIKGESVGEEPTPTPTPSEESSEEPTHTVFSEELTSTLVPSDSTPVSSKEESQGEEKEQVGEKESVLPWIIGGAFAVAALTATGAIVLKKKKRA